MAEKITLAEYDLDIDSLTAATAEILKGIEAIKAEQKELEKQGKRTDQAYVNNAITLRGLQKDYNAQLKVIDQAIAKSKQQASMSTQVQRALAKEGVTIDDLRAQNKELTKLRNQANLSTEEGRKQIEALNAQLDKNNEIIKNNVSELEQQKIGIGGYADAIRDALGDTGNFGAQLEQIKGILSSFAPVFSDMKSQIKDAFTSFMDAARTVGDLTKSQKDNTDATVAGTTAQKAAAAATNLWSASLKLLKVAIIGTGIGALVVLLGSVVAYLSSSEQASNKLGRVLGILGGIIAKLIDYLEPLGEFVVDVLVKGFENLGKVATASLNGVSRALSALGFERAAARVKEFNNEMANAAKAADRLTGLEQKLTEAQRRQGIVMFQYQTQAEKLRQQRDNENLTIQQRIAANEQLGETLREQLATEKQIAIQALEVANLRIAQDGATAANLDAQYAAMERMLDIQERITGQESEQLTNRVSLQKEAAQLAKDAEEQAKKAAQDRVNNMNKDLELWIAQQGVRARSLEQQLELEDEISKRRVAILQQELKSKLISQTEYDTALINLENERTKRQAEIAQQNLEYELKRVEDRIEVEKAVSKAVGLAQIEEERRRSQELAEAKAEFESQRFKQGIIDEQTYRNNVLELQQQSQLREIELRKQTDELLKQEREKQFELDLETAMLALETRHANEWEVRELQLQQDRERQLAAARQQYTDKVMLDQAILNIEQQTKNAQILLEQEKNRAIWQSRADLAGAIGQLLGEETVAGKAAAIAQATINTYLGATASLKLGWPIGPIAAAATIAQGLATVGRIVGIGAETPSINATQSVTQPQPVQPIAINAIPPFAEGGKVTGGIPIKRSNGDNVLATLKLGEVVLNKSQQAALGGDATFRALGIKGFATGGLVTSGNTGTVQRNVFGNFDTQTAEVIKDAVREGAQIGTRAGSRQGIVDSSTELYIQRLSSQ